jgi:uncharacterized protein YcbK (DUF882 family)
LHRRAFLKLGLAGAGAASVLGPETLARAATPAASFEPRRLVLHNLHTAEKLDAVYWEDGRYVPDAVAAADKLLRDYRNGAEHPIDVRLFDLLNDVRGKLGSKQPFQVISGYRSPQTNAMLHERSHQVASGSLHMKGMAMDVRIEGVALDHLHRAALSEKAGGVGFYPTSDFVHMDVGRVRQWNGS